MEQGSPQTKLILIGLKFGIDFSRKFGESSENEHF